MIIIFLIIFLLFLLLSLENLVNSSPILFIIILVVVNCVTQFQVKYLRCLQNCRSNRTSNSATENMKTSAHS